MMFQSYWYFIKLLGSLVNKDFLHYARYCTLLCSKSSQRAGESSEFPTLKGVDHPREDPSLSHTRAIPEATRDVVNERGIR
jgi:hypothetical protein